MATLGGYLGGGLETVRQLFAAQTDVIPKLLYQRQLLDAPTLVTTLLLQTKY